MSITLHKVSKSPFGSTRSHKLEQRATSYYQGFDCSACFDNTFLSNQQMYCRTHQDVLATAHVSTDHRPNTRQDTWLLKSLSYHLGNYTYKIPPYYLNLYYTVSRLALLCFIIYCMTATHTYHII
jgi:hypothetical protein